MSDDIRALTAELAADPASLVFLRLGEELRRRGQLDAALSVARTGVARHPDLADAQNLLARVHSDRGDTEGAFQSWTAALSLAPGHGAAHKGLAFLFYRGGDVPNARHHLAAALAADPLDDGIRAALARLDAPAPSQGPPPAPARPRFVFTEEMPVVAPAAADAGTELDQALEGAVLLDAAGLRLAGRIADPSNPRGADLVAARLAPVLKEAGRTARLLALGEWVGLGVEGPDASVFVVQPTPDTALAVIRHPQVPLARVAAEARSVAATARRWMEGLK